MSVQSALEQRYSVRAFTPQEPEPALVRQLLELAGRSPSAGNLQPWRVIALRGQPLAQVIEAVRGHAQEENELTASYPPDLWEPLRSRRFQVGERMYAALQIAHDDKAGRQAQAERNALFFGAPVGVFMCLDVRVQRAQWLDLGLYLQSLMLLATERGLATCAQGFWRRLQTPLRSVLQLPEGEMVACGLALGYADTAAAINQWRTDRAAPQEWLQLRGFA